MGLGRVGSCHFTVITSTRTKNESQTISIAFSHDLVCFTQQHWASVNFTIITVTLQCFKIVLKLV